MSRLFGVWSTKLRSSHCFALFVAVHGLLLSSAGCVLPDASLRETPASFTPSPSNSSGFPALYPATASPSCGDGRAQFPERCDGADLAGATCSTVMPGTLGDLGCIACLFDTSRCKTPQAGTVCGNGIKEGDEECDGADVGGALCPQPSNERPRCTNECQLDGSTCIPAATPAERFCGNNKREGDEICDGIDLAGMTCQIWMAAATGLPGCSRDCRSFDFLSCLPGQPVPRCGNDKREGNEVCDGKDLGGNSCSSLGAGTTGTLRCTTNCMFDVSFCGSPMRPSSGGTSGGGGSGAR